jgi:hypothetical protein
MKWSLLLLLSSIAFATTPDLTAPTAPLWSDIDDIVQYTPKAMPDAPILADAAKKDPRFVTGNARFTSGLHLEYTPGPASGSVTTYKAAAQMVDNTGRYFYRKFVIDVDSNQKQITNVSIVQDINLSSMHFSVSAGLIDRMVVVEDVADDILMAFPLGVGGLDENVMGLGKRILTPLYHGAWLDRAHVIKKRSDPAYYRNEPFMPITNARGSLTPIAFHVTILSDQDWSQKGPNYLLRGFESHGCMRLRLKDLSEFFNIVEHSADRRIPVDIDFFVWNRGPSGERDSAQGEVAQIHPYPLEDKSYMRVENFAQPGQPPVYQRDDQEHLIIMERVNHAPPLKGIKGFSADDLTEMSKFDGLTIDLDRLR